MSADLWAAFGSPEQTSSIRASQEAELPGTSATDHSQQSWILQSQRIPQPSETTSNGPLWKQDSKGTDVLFDASDDEQETDDFGDFEAAPSGTSDLQLTDRSQGRNASVDLLGLDDFSDMHITQPQKQSYLPTPSVFAATHMPEAEPNSRSPGSQSHFPHRPSATDIRDQSGYSAKDRRPEQSARSTPSSSDDDWGDFEDVAGPTNNPLPSTTPSHPAIPLEPAQADIDEDEDWDAFEDGPPTSTPSYAQPTRKQQSPTTQTPPPPYTLTQTHARPTNIPPPSTLLQLLPQIYTTLADHSRQTAPPTTLAHQTLQTLITTAHLISGRHHRWKRDTHLSQSTRISQAGVKNTGMKLTALDKSLTVKEDQDVADVIAAWQRHASALNAVMLKAKVSKPPGTLGVSMPVRTTSGPGVLASKECCAVCGLRRNERVNGIDVRVDDTFGEWWVEFWGHRDCYEFWYAYEGMLSRR